MKPLLIGIVGVGKIAREQHIPAIRGNAAFELAAGCVCGERPLESLAVFPSLEAMLEGCPQLDAVAVCSPTQTHYHAARAALEKRKHVLLEKPPCTTTAQLDDLVQLARLRDRTLFQSWHTCYAAAVDPVQRLLAHRRVRSASVVWKEAVRQSHPGQKWLWQAGGFGVFDAGVNALSVLAKVMPETIFVEAATLSIPADCETPVAASVTFATRSGARIEAEFDFRHEGDAVWDMQFETDEGPVSLGAYGNRLLVDGARVAVEPDDGEYPALYRRFAGLIRDGKSEIDRAPFTLLADIFLTGRRLSVDPFTDRP